MSPPEFKYFSESNENIMISQTDRLIPSEGANSTHDLIFFQALISLTITESFYEILHDKEFIIEKQGKNWQNTIK